MATLTDREVQALYEALDDEYHAWTTYGQVIADFGEVRPFINIREAEARHRDALCTLLTRYGLPIPDNPWPGKVERYPTVRAACEAAVEAEIANAKMYDRLMATTDRSDILAVLDNLRAASQERHLPAFQRCMERSGPSDGGCGGRRQRGGRGRA